MSKVKTHFSVLSCSGDGNLNRRFLYVHGEGSHHSLPISSSEARKRRRACQKKMKCSECDAEIHECVIVREKPTLKQIFAKRDG